LLRDFIGAEATDDATVVVRFADPSGPRWAAVRGAGPNCMSQTPPDETSVRSACEGPRAINLRGNDVAATPKPRCSSSTNIEDNRFALSRRLARQGYLKLAPPRRIFSGEAFAVVLGNPKLAVLSPVSECTDQLNQKHWHFKN
jgi:hypothetical protein